MQRTIAAIAQSISILHLSLSPEKMGTHFTACGSDASRPTDPTSPSSNAKVKDRDGNYLPNCSSWYIVTRPNSRGLGMLTYADPEISRGRGDAETAVLIAGRKSRGPRQLRKTWSRPANTSKNQKIANEKIVHRVY